MENHNPLLKESKYNEKKMAHHSATMVNTEIDPETIGGTNSLLVITGILRLVVLGLKIL